MAYDGDLVERVRLIINDEYPELAVDVSERAMFGGLAFMLRGNMAVAVGKTDELMVRCSREEVERHLADGATQTVMGTRVMKGWVDVTGEQVRDDSRLSHWVSVGMGYVSTLRP